MYICFRRCPVSVRLIAYREVSLVIGTAVDSEQCLRTVTRSHTHARMGDGWIDCRESVFGRACLIHVTIETSIQQQHSATSKYHCYWTLVGSIIVKASFVMRIDVCIYICVHRNISTTTAFHYNQTQPGIIGNAVYSCRHYTQ